MVHPSSVLMLHTPPGLRLTRFFFALVFATVSLGQARGVVLTPPEQAIADKIVNSSQQNRPFMVLDPILTQVARARAADMASRGYFSHVNPDGKGANYLVEQAGYKLPDWWGDSESANYIESIAAGRPTPDATWSDWMNSPDHRDHLLANTSFDVSSTSYGVGYAAKPGSPYTYYWVVLTAPPPPGPTLSLDYPAAGQRVFAPQVAIGGTTGGAVKAQSVVFRVENTLGLSPFTSASGATNFTAVATGLAPGGNLIRVRSLGVGGVVLSETTRSVTYAVVKPLTVAVNGSGAVTDGFLGTSSREVRHRYTIVATPAAGWLFSGWTGGAAAATRILNFTMAEGMSLTANFVPNPYLTRAGGYSGLLAGSESGVLRLSLTTSGGFTGTLRYGSHVYVVAGRFTPGGAVTLQIPRKGQTPLTASLSMDVSGTNGISGTVTTDGQSSTLQAAPYFQTGEGAFAGQGRYTVSLPPAGGAGDSVPKGNGYATLVVDRAGRARFSGALADGASLVASARFSSANTLSLYVPLYRNRGFISGIVNLRSSAAADLDGTLRWSKPAAPTARVRPEGIQVDTPLLGSLYLQPAQGTQVVAVRSGEENGELVLGEGNLYPEVVQPLTIDKANHIRLEAPALSGLRVRINPANGRFSGSFVHPTTKSVSALRGVIFQKQNAGFGFFIGQDRSGYTSLLPAP